MKNNPVALVFGGAALVQSSQALAHHEVSSAINAEAVIVAVAAAVIFAAWRLVKNRR